MQPCVKSQKAALLCHHHHPHSPLPRSPHCPRCSGVPHATEHPGSLTCAACCSHAWAAKISMGTQFSGYPPWPLLWLLCLQAKETVTFQKKKNNNFFLNLALKGDSESYPLEIGESCSKWKLRKKWRKGGWITIFLLRSLQADIPPGTVWNHTLPRTCSSCV